MYAMSIAIMLNAHWAVSSAHAQTDRDAPSFDNTASSGPVDERTAETSRIVEPLSKPVTVIGVTANVPSRATRTISARRGPRARR